MTRTDGKRPSATSGRAPSTETPDDQAAADRATFVLASIIIVSSAFFAIAGLFAIGIGRTDEDPDFGNTLTIAGVAMIVMALLVGGVASWFYRRTRRAGSGQRRGS